MVPMRALLLSVVLGAAAATGHAAAAPAPVALADVPLPPSATDAAARSDRPKRFEEKVDVVAESPTAADAPAEIPVRPADVMAVAGAADNVFRTLQTLPGVAATDEFGSRLSVRGGGPDQNLTVMDGVEIHNPYRLFGLTSAFNPETVESFELYAGGLHREVRRPPLVAARGREPRRRRRARASRDRRALSLTDANVVLEGRLARRRTGLVARHRRGAPTTTSWPTGSSARTCRRSPTSRPRPSGRPGPARRLTFVGLLSRESAELALRGQTSGEQGDLRDATPRNDLAALTLQNAARHAGLVAHDRCPATATRHARRGRQFRERRAPLQRARRRRSASRSPTSLFSRRPRACATSRCARSSPVRPRVGTSSRRGFEVHGLRTGVVWHIAGDRNPNEAQRLERAGGRRACPTSSTPSSTRRASAPGSRTGETRPTRSSIEPGLRLD